MIRVLIPRDEDFNIFKEECRELYESLQDKICDDSSFDFIINNTFFYIFEKDGYLIGGIYYFYDENNRLFVNAFAKRKTHEINLDCFNLSTTWFDDDIYAEAQNRMSVLCLLKCGFKRLCGNLFVKYKTLHN